MPLDTVIDYTPLSIRWDYDGYSFVALQTGKALHTEGAAMHHCVKTYWGHVISGQSRIYSIVQAGNRVATLELSCQLGSTAEKSNRYQLRQLAGPCNARPTPDVSKVARAFVEEINGGSTEFWSFQARSSIGEEALPRASSDKSDPPHRHRRAKGGSL